MQISPEYLQLGIVIGVLLVQVIAQWIWVRYEVQTLRRDSEAMDIAIEVKREANVEKLREIYDLKILDNRMYAKGLFEQSTGEFKALGNRLDGLEKQLAKVIDLLMNKT